MHILQVFRVFEENYKKNVSDEIYKVLDEENGEDGNFLKSKVAESPEAEIQEEVGRTQFKKKIKIQRLINSKTHTFEPNR